jgi:hypothetical protein
VVSDISESLREKQGHDEIANEQDRGHKPHEVLDAHSRSAPRTTRTLTAKNTTVRATKTTSAMLTPIFGGPFDHVPSLGRTQTPDALLNEALTRTDAILTSP